MEEDQAKGPAPGASGRPAGRRGRRPATVPAVAKPCKVAKQIKVAFGVHLKLETHALMEGKTVSEVVSDLVNAMPTRYVVHRRGEPGGATGDDAGDDPPALAVVSRAG